MLLNYLHVSINTFQTIRQNFFSKIHMRSIEFVNIANFACLFVIMRKKCTSSKFSIQSCEFESRSRRDVLDTTSCDD